MAYDASVTGSNSADIKWSRSKGAGMCIGGGEMGHRSTTFLLTQFMDPAYDLVAPIIIRYAREVWEASDKEQRRPHAMSVGYLFEVVRNTMGTWR